MTPKDFETWWDDLTFRFPTVEAWLVRVHAEAADQKRYLRQWQSVLADVDFHDAMDVNRLMQTGDVPWIADFQEQLLPQHVRRQAKILAARRTPLPDQPVDGFDASGQRPSSFPAGKILLRIWQLQRAGLATPDARRQALEEFPIGSPDRPPRFHCLRCQDTGRVLVASNAAIIAILAGTFAACHHREGVVRCSCRPAAAPDPHRLLVTYSASLDFALFDPLWGESETARFSEWCQAQRNRSDELVKTAVNYEPKFAEWNQRGK